MLDVHPPHEAAHSFRDFLIHIATIVIGLLIAVGLEQTVEYFHHRHQVEAMRESLRIERQLNVNRSAVLTDEFHRFVPKLQTNLAVFVFLRTHPNAPPAQWPGRLDWLAMSIGFTDAAWRTAQQSAVLQYVPRSEVQKLSALYARQQAVDARIQAAQAALNEARRFAILDPDPSHLSPAQLDRQVDLTLEVLLQYSLIGREQKNLAGRFPDFTPALSRDDVYGILHATTDPDDQKALDALSGRIGRMESDADGAVDAGTGP